MLWLFARLSKSLYKMKELPFGVTFRTLRFTSKVFKVNICSLYRHASISKKSLPKEEADT